MNDMNDMNDIYTVKCCLSFKLCKDFVYRICFENHGKIQRVVKKYPIEIVLVNGEHILVMTYESYGEWCKGRNYKHYGEDDVIYHSGFALKQ